MKVVICILFTILLSNGLHAAWRAVHYNPKVISEHYDIRGDSLCKKTEGFSSFYFHKRQADGYSISCLETLEELKSAEEYPYLIKKFENPIKILEDTTTLIVSLFCNSIQNYTVYIHDQLQDTWIERKVSCESDGFQIPFECFISNLSKENDLTYIDKIGISLSGCTHSSYQAFILQLKILDICFEEETYDHPIVDQFIGRKTNYKITPKYQLTSNTLDSHILIDETVEYNDKLFSSQISFVQDSLMPSGKPSSEIELVKQIMDVIIAMYPFYTEKELDPVVIRSEWNKFYDSNKKESLDHFYNMLSIFISNKFKDSHFYFTAPKCEKNFAIMGPIRLYPIRDRIMVAAVFDEEYEQIIPVGSEIITIGNIPVRKLIDSLASLEPGPPHFREMSAIRKILYRDRGDSVSVFFRNAISNATEMVKIYYDRKITVPSAFRKQNRGFDLIDSVAYIKINQFDEYTFMRFCNYLKFMSSAKGLIIDLRGNGGGDTSAAQEIFSLFIDKPMVYDHRAAYYNEFKKESSIVRPDVQFHFPKDYRVVLLGDEHTFCSAEDFIQAMRVARSNCYFIASSMTAGLLHSRFDLYFPSGASMSIDCLTGKISANKAGVIENKGLEPDIWLQPHHVLDLAPYNDLLKKTAVSFMQ